MRCGWIAIALAIAGCSAATGSLRPDADLPGDHPIDCQGDFDSAPRLQSGKSPIFPASIFNPDYIEDRKIRHLPLRWQVTTRFDVLADGSTANIRSGATQPPFFATHTNAAIKAWGFAPATRAATAVVAACTHVLEFTIDR